MDTVKKTAVVCFSEEEFISLTQFRHEAGIHEFFHVTTKNGLNMIDNLTNVIYLASAKELTEFDGIREVVNDRGVAQKWQ